MSGCFQPNLTDRRCEDDRDCVDGFFCVDEVCVEGVPPAPTPTPSPAPTPEPTPEPVDVDAGFDAGTEDAGPSDAGVDDAGVDDAGVDDAGFDAGADAGPPPPCGTVSVLEDTFDTLDRKWLAPTFFSLEAGALELQVPDGATFGPHELRAIGTYALDDGDGIYFEITDVTPGTPVRFEVRGLDGDYGRIDLNETNNLLVSIVGSGAVAEQLEYMPGQHRFWGARVLGGSLQLEVSNSPTSTTTLDFPLPPGMQGGVEVELEIDVALPVVGDHAVQIESVQVQQPGMPRCLSSRFVDTFDGEQLAPIWRTSAGGIDCDFVVEDGALRLERRQGPGCSASFELRPAFFLDELWFDIGRLPGDAEMVFTLTDGLEAASLIAKPDSVEAGVQTFQNPATRVGYRQLLGSTMQLFAVVDGVEQTVLISASDGPWVFHSQVFADDFAEDFEIFGVNTP